MSVPWPGIQKIVVVSTSNSEFDGPLLPAAITQPDGPLAGERGRFERPTS